MAEPASRTPDATPDATTFECAVCLEAAPAPPPHRRCCSREGSTIQVCQDCLRVICERGAAGVGRCPSCRAYYRLNPDSGAFELCEAHGTCHMCQQPRPIVSPPDAPLLCDGCTLGMRIALRYECEGCGSVQRIPHPMWRYQANGPAAFGADTWACHARCGGFTHWRVSPADVDKVPPEDAPDSWGLKEEWLASIRVQRQAERAAQPVVSQMWDAASGLVPVFVALFLAWCVRR